jgi:hypothetical protein
MKKYPEIGDWVTICCYCDLYQVLTQEEIDEIISDNEDGIGYKIFSSLKEAIRELDLNGGDPDSKKGFFNDNKRNIEITNLINNK